VGEVTRARRDVLISNGHLQVRTMRLARARAGDNYAKVRVPMAEKYLVISGGPLLVSFITVNSNWRLHACM
jgi:hypothetical protein